MAKRLDRLWKSVGRIYKERYHQHVLSKPLEVRKALVYVINNAKHHGSMEAGAFDSYSSAAYFEGFANVVAKALPVSGLLAQPRGWSRSVGEAAVSSVLRRCREAESGLTSSGEEMVASDDVKLQRYIEREQLASVMNDIEWRATIAALPAILSVVLKFRVKIAGEAAGNDWGKALPIRLSNFKTIECLDIKPVVSEWVERE